MYNRNDKKRSEGAAVVAVYLLPRGGITNQSTLVLGYLLLYGYDVTGKSYQMPLLFVSSSLF